MAEPRRRYEGPELGRDTDTDPSCANLRALIAALERGDNQERDRLVARGFILLEADQLRRDIRKGRAS